MMGRDYPLIDVLVATFLLVVSIWLVRVARVWILKRLERVSSFPGRFSAGVGSDLKSYIFHAVQTLTRLAAGAAIILLVYLWLVYLLSLLPFTAAWGEQLGEFLVDLFWNFGSRAVGALPGLFTVVIIILIARWCVRVVNVIFKEMDRGKLSLPGLERETARTTQTLLIFAVWLFALVVAYPFIPGSDTEAFKGLSVLVGLMITLGSTELINQVISGLFVIYSRSLRTGDCVRVGDIEGQVMNVGFLATKLKTPRQEEITLPHSVLVGAATTNYSRLAGDDGMVIPCR
jgi:small-conductance mechanosensitive channel